MAECIFAFGEAALPVRFEDGQPADAGLWFEPPAAPGRPFALAARPPPAGERGAFFRELEAAGAGDLRLAIAELERIAVRCALDARWAAALVEAPDAPAFRDQAQAAEIRFPDAVPATHRGSAISCWRGAPSMRCCPSGPRPARSAGRRTARSPPSAAAPR